MKFYGSTEPYLTERPRYPKQFLIETNPSTDPVSSASPTSVQVKKARILSFYRKTLAFSALGLVLISLPTPVHAGLGNFTSYFSSLFHSSKEVPRETAEAVSEQAMFLRAAVNIDPNLAKGGGDITIVNGMALLPETGPSGSIGDIEDSFHSDQISLYIVRQGDTLSGIASMFGVSSNTILWANDLKKGTTLKEGQSLIILPISGLRYTIKAGDTVQSIAKKYQAEASDILAFNQLGENTKLAQGDVLIIPHGVESVVVAPQPTSKLRGAGGTDTTGFFIRPVNGIKTQGLHGYNGVDIGAPRGSTIVAAAAGTVIIARSGGYNGGYGTYVVIQHSNGVQTLYAHMTALVVSVGDIVTQGQMIGTVGTTGKATGPHLHFEVRGGVNPF